MAVPSNTSPPGEWMRRLISVRSPRAFRSRANCWAVMPHIPISSYSRISACPLESALMLYQLSLGALLAVRAAMGASSARLLVVRIGASSFLGVVIGVRAEHQPFFPVGLDLGNPAAPEFLRVAATGARHFSLISEAGLHQLLPGVRLFLRIDPRHDRAFIGGVELRAQVDVRRQ